MCDKSIQLNMKLLLLLSNIIDGENNIPKEELMNNYLNYYNEFQNALYESYDENIKNENIMSEQPKIVIEEIIIKPNKNVTFKANNELNQKGGETYAVNNKKSKEEKIRSKCEALWANNVKNIGKKLNIQPEKGKKTLSKTYVINQIIQNKNLHNKALRELNKFDLVKSETAS
ncbi:hypothetical protein mvtv_2 [Megavirus vitis transpoviron]|uniref:Uncharacterized protein n=1 Tax=Megavirus vitis transpoviron TaxID=2711275 RepID=A0A2P1EHG5_9VIRU|nr:hypothetical protein mvtv_2 [Megavirus vitis transpoviron]